MIGFAVGLDLKAGKAGNGNFLALLRIDPLQPCKLGSRAVAHQLLRGCKCKSRRRPAARAPLPRRFRASEARNDAPTARATFWKGCEHHATIRREKGKGGSSSERQRGSR
jgi:hypothetical protein